jgi:hypothetical protein
MVIIPTRALERNRPEGGVLGGWLSKVIAILKGGRQFNLTDGGVSRFPFAIDGAAHS